MVAAVAVAIVVYPDVARSILKVRELRLLLLRVKSFCRIPFVFEGLVTVACCRGWDSGPCRVQMTPAIFFIAIICQPESITIMPFIPFFLFSRALLAVNPSLLNCRLLKHKAHPSNAATKLLPLFLLKYPRMISS